MYREWLAYGSDAKRIAEAFTAGINAYLDLIEQQPDLLPVEFAMLDYRAGTLAGRRRCAHPHAWHHAQRLE